MSIISSRGLRRRVRRPLLGTVTPESPLDVDASVVTRGRHAIEAALPGLASRDLRPAAITFALIDAQIWFLGLWIASALRLESPALSASFTLQGHATPFFGLLLCAGSAVLLYTVLARPLRLHQGRHLVGSFEELLPLTALIAVVAAVMTAANILVPAQIFPRTVPLIAAPIVLVLAGTVRAGLRVVADRDARRLPGGSAQRALIVGAGEVGRALADSMRRDPSSVWEPVAFLDDDPRKRYLRHGGISVLGTTAQLAEVVHRTDVDVVVIATTVIGGEQVAALTAEAKALGLGVRIVPPLGELIDGVSHRDLRAIEPQDLLGRRQVETDLSTISTLLAGKTVLVTGAGGSIGSELCRQIAGFAPKELVMLDRDESALHALLLSMGGTADLGNENMELADIRDAGRLEAVFARHRPQVVFHAAALKHVNMLEKCPDEAYKTNVLGTHNVLEAAHRHGVDHFVNISTDKAADPHNVLGLSKRIAEGLTARKARAAGDGTWLSVRFGNVLATRGSVIHTFIAQIERGGPVTVTDPDVTRYFMTVSEAVQLVLQAAVVGESGKALVLDMGEPVPIVHLAEQLIEASGKDVEIVFSGLRPGEKLHEVLFAPGENSTTTSHPLITGVPVAAVDRQDIPDPEDMKRSTQFMDAMTTVCGTMSAPVALGAGA